MHNLTRETLAIAQKRFETFGFQEDQIEKLLISGRDDLEKEIGKLQHLLKEEKNNLSNINQTLHALKGLLYNMGNNAAGDMMNELRDQLEDAETIQKIKRLIEV